MQEGDKGKVLAGATGHGGAKIAIGVLAGVTAVLMPRLLALLSKSDDANITFFPLSYFVLAAGVGVFLGLVMLVLEYQVVSKPKETFMAALGIPAVISGALGTASTAENVSDLARDADRLRQAVRIEQGIVKETRTFTDISPVEGPAAPPKPAARKTSSAPLPFISAAHASEPLAQANAGEPLRFGVRAEQPRYVVVLRQTATEQQAIDEARKLKAQIPSARAVRADKSYFVILGNPPASETEALIAATRAKKALQDHQVQPVLIEVKR